MKHSILAALLLATHLAVPAQGTRSMSAPIGVEVVDGRVQVSNAGYRASASQAVTTWRINTPGWRFAEGSIRFTDAAAPFSCAPFAEGAAMRCTSSGGGTGRYGYTISLLDDTGSLVTPPQPSVYISLD